MKSQALQAFVDSSVILFLQHSAVSCLLYMLSQVVIQLQLCFGIGKKSVFKAIYDHPDDFSDLLTLNNEDDASALQAARKLTSALYDPKAKRTDAIQNLINLRVKLASKKNASLI